MSAIQKALKKIGVKQVADKFGISVAAVYKWETEVPVDRCVDLEVLCKGNLSRKQMRPRDWKKYWPELAGVSRKHVGTDRRAS